ncbi:17.3 kDa class I heat shock protein [Arachis hypogaea]|nr:17.3 kDa class I heat shock protein [Arachis hypogaea]
MAWSTGSVLNLTTVFFPDDVDWKETPAAHVFRTDVPGLSRDEVRVEIVKGWTVRIYGKRARDAREGTTDTWRHVGRWSGRFERTFKLPQNACVDQLRASMKHGVLTITVPKVEPLRPLLFNLRDSYGQHAILHSCPDLIHISILGQPEPPNELARTSLHAVPPVILLLLLPAPLTTYLQHPPVLNLHLHFFLLQPRKIHIEHVRLRSLLPVHPGACYGAGFTCRR